MFDPEIEAALKTAYRDFDNPNYDFVRDAIAQADRDQALIEDLQNSGFTVQDDTDVNVDVSRVLIVSLGASQYVIRLSFVGKFGVVFSLLDNQKSSFDAINGVVKEHGYRVLDENTLSDPYAINLIDVDEKPNLYNALFSTDMMPR